MLPGCCFKLCYIQCYSLSNGKALEWDLAWKWAEEGTWIPCCSEGVCEGYTWETQEELKMNYRVLIGMWNSCCFWLLTEDPVYSTFQRNLNSYYFVHYTLKLLKYRLGSVCAFVIYAFFVTGIIILQNNSHPPNSPVNSWNYKFAVLFLVFLCIISEGWRDGLWCAEHRELALKMLLFLGHSAKWEAT